MFQSSLIKKATMIWFLLVVLWAEYIKEQKFILTKSMTFETNIYNQKKETKDLLQ